ncbi:L,D-transpeptidase [Frankia sp. Cj5]|uniref:L,D-transpeptidase n=1 Tax=Frankia sp. Cj5 TaxID=2880978 RepID=UPI00351D18A7
MSKPAVIGCRRPGFGPAASAVSISAGHAPASPRMKILLAVLAGMVVFTGCGGGGSKTQSQASATAIPDPVRSQLAAVTSVNTDGMNTIVTATGGVVDVYKTPTAKTAASQLRSPNPEGVPRVFLVVAKLPNWWHVLLPVEPNGSTGWVKASQVRASLTGYHIVVARKDHRLRVYDKTAVVLDEPISVGTTDTPTPGGRFYLTELLQPRNPAGPYGPYAFGLSGFSTTLDSFDGQDPVIGIHGTNQPNLIGQDISHGCIRVRNDVITRLAKMLPLGTPVEIAA